MASRFTINAHVMSFKTAQVISGNSESLMIDVGHKIELQPIQPSLVIYSNLDLDVVHLIHSQNFLDGIWISSKFPLMKIDFNHRRIMPDPDNVLVRVYERGVPNFVGYPGNQIMPYDDAIMWSLGSGYETMWRLGINDK